MSLGQEIKLLREKKDFSRVRIAEYLGMSRATYEKVEAGDKDLTLPEAKKLSSLLGVSFNDLFGTAVHSKSENYDPKRYKDMIRRFIAWASDDSDKRITKTKLAKLLYLADFSWFYDNLEPISGLEYRRDPQGPVPDEFFRVIDQMYDTGEIGIKFSGKAMMISLNDPLDESEQSKLNEKQINRIKKIASEWKTARTDAIVRYTHDQLPWRLCDESEPIPYELILQEDPDNVYKRLVSSPSN